MADQLSLALDALRSGKCVAILDDEGREAETDLFFPAASIQPADMRMLRVEAGGELYIAIGNDVAATFGIPFISAALDAASTAGGKPPAATAADQAASAATSNGVSNTPSACPSSAPGYPLLAHLSKGVDGMCQGSCSVGLSLDHRTTHTGAPDSERSLTCRRLAQLWEEIERERKAGGGVEEEKAGAGSADDAMRRLGAEFHTPGHIFTCVENAGGLRRRQGHTELSVALGRLAGITPVLVGCVMLSNSGDDFGALPATSARKWAAAAGVPCLTGPEIIKAVLGDAAAAAAV